MVVVGATNRPDLVDPALLRPGRMGRLVFVPPPDAEARAAILRAAAKNIPLGAGVDLDAVAADTDGYSGADLTALLREAALAAMRRSMDAAGGHRGRRRQRPPRRPPVPARRAGRRAGGLRHPPPTRLTLPPPPPRRPPTLADLEARSGARRWPPPFPQDRRRRVGAATGGSGPVAGDDQDDPGRGGRQPGVAREHLSDLRELGGELPGRHAPRRRCRGCSRRS